MDIANGHSDITENDIDDIVNHPKHYTAGAIECIDYINACSFDYLEGNIVKYITNINKKTESRIYAKQSFTCVC